MKYLKFFPLLIAAAFMVPRAHAAQPQTVEAPAKTSSQGLLLAGLVVMCLSSRGRKDAPFKP